MVGNADGSATGSLDFETAGSFFAGKTVQRLSKKHPSEEEEELI